MHGKIKLWHVNKILIHTATYQQQIVKKRRWLTQSFCDSYTVAMKPVFTAITAYHEPAAEHHQILDYLILGVSRAKGQSI